MTVNFSNCANAKYDTPDEVAEAAKGIINPVKGRLAARSCILRFGRSFNAAVHGSWWYSLEEHGNIENVALLHRLSYPYVARVMTATLHEYSDMTHLVRVETTADLVYFHGKSKRQARHLPFSDPKDEKFYEIMNGLDNVNGSAPRFVQYYIPGMNDPNVTDIALGPHKPMSVFAAAESHMFGTPLSPGGHYH